MRLLRFEKIKKGSKIHNVFTLFGIRFKFFIGIANSLYVNKYLQDIKPYKSSSHKIWDVEPNERGNILKLDWNEATIPPSPKVLERLQTLLKESSFLNLYPKTFNKELLELLSKYLDLPTDNIQYFASSDAIHEYISKLYIKENDKILIQGPSYDNFRLTAEANGANIFYSNVDSETYSLDETKFKEDIKKIKPSFVYICSPNNPCGFVNSNEYLEGLLKSFPGIMFLVDEAYAEFSGVSAKELVLKYDNILVTRTMSKAFALANLRFGYLIASKSNINSITSIRNPKNIGTFTQEAAIAVLSDVQYMKDYVEEVKKAKKYFYEEIKKFPQIKVFPSSSNFILMKFDNFGLKTRFFNFLKEKDIFIRELIQSPILYDCLRITIGTKEQIKYVLQVFEQFFDEQKNVQFKNNKKIALFDFCETIVDFQTGDAFIYYVYEKENSIKNRIRRAFIKKKIKLKRKINKKYNSKLDTLSLLKGFSYDILNKHAKNFYIERIRNRFIPKIIDELLRLKKEGYRIYVISGGYDLYLKYFIEEFQLNGFFSTKIKFLNNTCFGCFDGIDCMEDNKVKILNDFFKNEKINEYQTVAYSDSPTDIPLLKYCKEAFVVTPTESSWADNTGFKKIIYSKKDINKRV